MIELTFAARRLEGNWSQQRTYFRSCRRRQLPSWCVIHDIARLFSFRDSAGDHDQPSREREEQKLQNLVKNSQKLRELCQESQASLRPFSWRCLVRLMITQSDAEAYRVKNDALKTQVQELESRLKQRTVCQFSAPSQTHGLISSTGKLTRPLSPILRRGAQMQLTVRVLRVSVPLKQTKPKAMKRWR